MTGVFKCPVCGNALQRDGVTLKCEKRHSYDISSSGHVNLAMQQSGKTHGDDTFMVMARRDFLSSGYYEPLRTAVCEAVNGKTVLDAGCGEGYYTRMLAENVCVEKVYGIDISKKAVQYASKLCKGDKFGTFCVGSVYSMPYLDSSFDTVVNIFSPLALDEYKRVLKKDGTLVLAVPNPDHLLELKERVYEDVRVKEESDDILDGFTLCEKKRVCYKFTPETGKTVADLFAMTPYYYTTPAEKREKLSDITPFEITADFSVIIYLKNG